MMDFCNPLPSTVTLAANFGVDNVQARLTGKVLKILYNEIRPSPIQLCGICEVRENKAIGVPGPGMLGPRWEQGKSKGWGV